VKNILLKLNWILVAQFGIDLFKLVKSIYNIPYYIRTLFIFKKKYKGELFITPCLHDRYDNAGAVNNEYFWQDLLVSQLIFADNPKIHVDIGSRLDGFVAQVAAYREIEVFDIRYLEYRIKNIVFNQADLMDEDSIKTYKGNSGYCDSISCLHAIEHFGLGRYGDILDSFGYEKGIANISKLLRHGGILYLSAPIGCEDYVEFNANWVFSPNTIVNCAKNNGLKLKKMVIFNEGSAKEIKCYEIDGYQQDLKQDLCIYIFKKE
jgi:hypothetical protein